MIDLGMATHLEAQYSFIHSLNIYPAPIMFKILRL